MVNRIFYTFILIMFPAVIVMGQNWSTFGGNSTRNGLSEITGPQNTVVQYWNQTSPLISTLGNAVYTFGDHFVTSRVNFSPYQGRVEKRNLQDGSLEYIAPFLAPSSILYVIGYNEDGIYAHDYSNDTIVAYDPVSGMVKWTSQLKSQTFGAYPGCVFACNGDLIVNGPLSSGIFTMRLDKNTGDTVWTNPELIAIGPAVGLAASASTVYRITGGITIPIVLTAIDINTGQTKYSSLPIPGDPDQENPITLGLDGEIYFWRDGGYLYSYTDNGSTLVQNWTYIPQSVTGAALYGNISVGPDGHLYVFDTGNLLRINHTNGTVMDTALMNISTGVISVGADSTVYVNNKSGAFYAFSADLQVLKWQLLMGGNTYCNMALAKDGIMVFTGSGSLIVAHQGPQNLPPVADFRSGDTTPTTGNPVNFFDQSSYTPFSWQWNFPGGNPASSTLQNPTGIIYNAPGIYEVSLSVQNSFGSDSVLKTCYLEVTDPSGIAEEIPDKFHVYPNPAISFVKVFSASSKDAPIIFTDITGRVLHSEIPINGFVEADVSSWSPGIYFVHGTEETSPVVKLVIASH